MLSSRFYIHIHTGQFGETALGQELSALQKRRIFVVVRSSVLEHFLTVHRKIKIFAAAPVFEIQIVLPGKFFDRCLRRYVLIGAVLEQIVERAVFCIKKLTGSHHRQEKQSETAAGDQDGADQKLLTVWRP